MRIPRWLLVSLIAVSTVALLAVPPVWLWVEMPRRTAENFVAAIEAGDLEQANAFTGTTLIIDPSQPRNPDAGHQTLNLWKLVVVAETREPIDVLRGLQKLSLQSKDGIRIGISCTASWRNVNFDWSVFDAKLNEIGSIEYQRRRREILEQMPLIQTESLTESQ